MQMYENNKHMFSDELYKIPVWDHKTVKAHGAAPVILKPHSRI